MCEFEKRLVAWLDRELPEDEDAELELHVRACTECRSQAQAYERTTLAFNAYCDEVVAASERSKTSPLKSVALGAGAILAAAVVVIVAFYPRAPVTRPQPRVTAPVARAPRTVLAGAPNLASREANPRKSVPIKRTSAGRIPGGNLIAQAQLNATSYLPRPAVQIDIPADALLPPGAAPAGTNFVVDFSVAPDGSAQPIRVTPQLAGFERRVAQP